MHPRCAKIPGYVTKCRNAFKPLSKKNAQLALSNIKAWLLEHISSLLQTFTVATKIKGLCLFKLVEVLVQLSLSTTASTLSLHETNQTCALRLAHTNAIFVMLIVSFCLQFAPIQRTYFAFTLTNCVQTFLEEIFV